jgi:hypothetical protein
MMRSLRRLFVTLLAAATCLLGMHLVTPAAASAAPCANDNQWTNAPGKKDRRCVNGVEYATRKQLLAVPGCLAGPLVQNYVYASKKACYGGGGVEAIGQARAIKFLSDRLETPSQGLISPNVQWEMTLRDRDTGDRRRPDIVVYNRFPSAVTGVYPVTGVHVIEAKVRDNYDPVDWANQIDAQIGILRKDGMAGVRRATILRDLSPNYRDTFKVWDDSKGKCTVANGNAGYRLRTYVATAPLDGLLIIDEDTATYECAETKPDPEKPNVPITVDGSGNVVVTTLPATTEQRRPRPSGADCLRLGAPTAAFVQTPVRVTPVLPAAGAAAADTTAVTVGSAEILAAEAGTGLVAALGGPVTVTIAAAVVAVVVVDLAVQCGGSIFGDPHLATADGLAYDLQSVGEFTLADSDQLGVHAQVRLAPSPVADISLASRVAVELGDSRVEFAGTSMYVDGAAVTLAAGQAWPFGDDQFVLRSSSGEYQVLFDGLDGAFLTWRNGRLGFYVPPAAGSDLVGLLGNADGNPANDLRLADGTQLPATASPSTLHGDFADSWRLTDDESLFSYGAGETTATYTDVTFPHNIKTVHDLTADQVRIASAQCEAADVPAGPTFSACVLDVALTADSSFATQAAEQRDVSVDPSALGLDGTGRLRADFEASALPTNVRPARVSTDAATTSFAGGFSGTDTYRAYVQSLPSHTGGTLSFDLLALGDWTAGTGTKKVTVETDRAAPYTVTPTSLTPTRSGTLASGVAYKVYRVTMPFTHTASQAEFTVSATNVTGLGGQAFGVDNVDLQVTLVPAQHFSGSLPLTVSSGVPAAGAGNLETAVSVDDYTVTLPAAGGLFVDVTSCAQSTLNWSLLDSAGKEVGYGFTCRDGEARDLPAGTYKLVTRSNPAAGAYALTLKAIPADATYALTLGAAAVTTTTTAAGQNATAAFSATAGQRVSLQLTGGTYSSAWAELYRPDGARVGSWFCASSCFTDAVTLPVAGTYKLLVDPDGANTGSIAVRGWSVPADAAYTVTLGGAAVTAATTAPGQNATVSFAGTAGQKASVQLSSAAFTGTAWAYLYAPDGTQLYSWPCSSGCFIDPTTLPATGTYRVVVNPDGAATGSISVRGFSVPADPAYTMTLGGAAVTATTTVPGQNATVSFAGTAGQKASVQLTGGAFTGTSWAYVYRPDGTQLDSWPCSSSCFFEPMALATTGTYKVVVNPDGAATGSISVRGWSVPADPAYTMTLGGAAVTVTTTAAGQNAAVSFAATANQKVSVQLSGGTYSGVGSAILYKPDGTRLYSWSCTTSCFIDAYTLPVTGTYKLVVDPNGASTGSISVRGWSVPADSAYTMTVGGAAVTAATTVPGQNAAVTFAGTAGKTVTVQLSGGTYTGVGSAKLYKPDGTQLASAICTTSCSFTNTALATTGTYKVFIDPDAASTGSISVKAVLVA